VTADPQPAEPEPIGWERPILHVRIGLEGDKTLHILNVHLKSKAPTDIVGQNKDVPDPKPPPFAWRKAYGWAEGFFVSFMKRVGQALEARIIVDDLFTQDPSSLIVVCGTSTPTRTTYQCRLSGATWRTLATQPSRSASWCPASRAFPSLHATPTSTMAKER
jgi:hypothetical protein